MELQTNRTLLVNLSFLVLLLAVIGIGVGIGKNLSELSIILLSIALIMALGIGSGALVFLNRYPPQNSNSGTALHWMTGLLLIVLIAELYYLICTRLLGLTGTVEKFASLGDSFGPLGGIFSGVALFLSILTSRSQSIVQQKQQEQIEQQTEAWIQQAAHQKSQADELKINNSLYRHMLLAQRMATAASIRVRLTDAYVDKEKFLRESKTQDGVGLSARLHNLPYKGRVDFEIKQLKKLLSLEVDMINMLAKEIEMTEEQLQEIKQWEEIISSPINSPDLKE